MKKVFLTLTIVLAAGSVAAQPAFPQRGVEIVNELYAGVNPQDDAARRLAIHRVCAQMVYELGVQWGNKKRTGLSDDFRSPDSIAWRVSDGQPVSVWDIQSSSGQILVSAGKPPDYPNLPTSEAEFMPCAPMNYLTPAPPPPTPAPSPQPAPPPVPQPVPTIDLSKVYERLDALDVTTKAIQQDTHDIRAAKNQALKFVGKYIAPALGAAITAWIVKPENTPTPEPTK
jgi:hypothetical protein